jgi:hypothetical protein
LPVALTEKNRRERRFLSIIGSSSVATRSAIATTTAAAAGTATAPVVTRRTGVALGDLLAAGTRLVLEDYPP